MIVWDIPIVEIRESLKDWPNWRCDLGCNDSFVQMIMNGFLGIQRQFFLEVEGIVNNEVKKDGRKKWKHFIPGNLGLGGVGQVLLYRYVWSPWHEHQRGL